MYSTELSTTIIDLRKLGKNLREISKITGKKETALRNWLARHQIYKKDNRINIINQLTTEELAYIAGIIDGEGSIVICKLKAQDRHTFNDEYRLFMKVVNTDKRLIEYLSKKTLTPFTTEKYRKKRPNARLTFNIHWSVDVTIYLLNRIYPYLVIKQEQADIAVKFKQTFSNKYGKNATPKDIVLLRHKYYLQMKELHNREFI